MIHLLGRHRSALIPESSRASGGRGHLKPDSRALKAHQIGDRGGLTPERSIAEENFVSRCLSVVSARLLEGPRTAPEIAPTGLVGRTASLNVGTERAVPLVGAAAVRISLLVKAQIQVDEAQIQLDYALA
ncbi:hypothetical protein WN73_37900 [Bradyrhizobium sp. CCBAU 45394]|nr:hypothetical protein [Bradyrhizobium sp. CCBAU 45394]